jgi:hypothetical protein
VGWEVRDGAYVGDSGSSVWQAVPLGAAMTFACGSHAGAPSEPAAREEKSSRQVRRASSPASAVAAETPTRTDNSTRTTFIGFLR